MSHLSPVSHDESECVSRKCGNCRPPKSLSASGGTNINVNKSFSVRNSKNRSIVVVVVVVLVIVVEVVHQQKYNQRVEKLQFKKVMFYDAKLGY